MFFGDLQLFKENHLFYEKKYDFATKVIFLVIFYWFQSFNLKQEKHTIYIFFLWNCTKYPFLTFPDVWKYFLENNFFMLQYIFFYLKFRKLVFFSVFNCINCIYTKPPFTSITYAIWIIHFSTFFRVLQYFYNKSIIP